MPSPAGLRIAELPYFPGMEEAEAYCPPGVGLPTVAHDRGHGITSIRVYCEGLYCPHWRIFTFDEMKVPDEMPVIHIPRVRRFVCSKCGSRKVQVRSVWPERKAGNTFYSPAFDRDRQTEALGAFAAL
jgi:hypothetical protein